MLLDGSVAFARGITAFFCGLLGASRASEAVK